jgi:hypothetical protein
VAVRFLARVVYRGGGVRNIPLLAIWLLAALAACTSAAQSVRLAPLAGQSPEQQSTDAAECDTRARKEARYRPLRPAGADVVRGTADLPAHEVVGAGSGVGGTVGQGGGFVIAGKLGVLFGGPDRELYTRLYADCMTQRGYQPVPRGTAR